MKGIILAGGHGSRLYPLTKMFNKSLLPVYDKPMIYYSINTLKQLGCEEIMIVSGRSHSGQIMNHLGSGSEFDMDITYRVQDKPGGIAQALGLCREFSGTDNIFVCLGDNIFEDDFSNLELNYVDSWCHLFFKKVPDPERFGVPVFRGIGRHLTEVQEKPENPKSDYAVTGLYMFNSDVWSIINTLKPSARGELEIVDVINWYVDRGKTTYSKVKGFWSDAGTPDSLVHANKLVSRSKRK